MAEVGALVYKFKADTSSLQDGIAQAQNAIKKAADDVKQASSNFEALGKQASSAIKMLPPDLVKAKEAIDKIGAAANKNANEIAKDFRKAGSEIKKAFEGTTNPLKMPDRTPASNPASGPRNDNDQIISGLDRWSKSKYDVVAGLSAAAKKAGTDVNDFGEKAAKGVGLARHELVNLSRQMSDVAVSLAGGQSPFMVLMQQGSQISDIFTSSKGSISGFVVQIASAVGNAVLNLRNIGIAAGAAFAGIEIAAKTAQSKLADLSEEAKKTALSTEKLLGAQIKGASVGLSSSDVSDGLSSANKAFEDYKRNSGSVLSTVKEIDKSFLKTLDSTTSFGQWLDVVANKIRALPATQARDLAEAVFPADKAQKFIELINQGQFSIASFQRAADAAGGGFSEIADQAAEIRTRLAAADEEVNSRLLISFAKLATPLGSAASLWTDIKNAIADSIPYIERFLEVLSDVKNRLGQAYEFLKSQISDIATEIRSDLAEAISALQGPMAAFTSGWDFISGKIAKVIDGVRALKGMYEQAAKAADNMIVGEPSAEKKKTSPTPMLAGGFKPGSNAGSLDKFKPSEMFLSTVGNLKGQQTGSFRSSYEKAQDALKSGKSETDKLDEYIKNLREANQLAQAEVDTFALGNVEKEKSAALIKAENIAREQGRSLTVAQRNEILQLSGNTQGYKESLEQLKNTQNALNDAMRQFGDFAASAMSDLITRSKKASDVLRDLVKMLASSALKGLLTGDGFMGQLMGLAGKGGQTGGLIGSAVGALSKGFAGLFAEGGSIPAGQWGIAGEKGPEAIVGPASVIPMGKGGNAAKVTVNNYSSAQVEARQLSDGEIVVLVQNAINANNRRIPGIMADAQRRAI